MIILSILIKSIQYIMYKESTEILNMKLNIIPIIMNKEKN